jgi:cytochrome c oxidase subunit 3
VGEVIEYRSPREREEFTAFVGMELSSASLHSGYHALRRGEQRRSAARVAVSTVLGISFFAGQAAIWIALAQRGLSLTSSPFGSLFYGLTGIHLAHVAVGLGALGWLTWRVHRGLTNPARYLALRLWGLYWHFVGVIWLILFVSVYLL